MIQVIGFKKNDNPIMSVNVFNTVNYNLILLVCVYVYCTCMYIYIYFNLQVFHNKRTFLQSIDLEIAHFYLSAAENCIINSWHSLIILIKLASLFFKETSVILDFSCIIFCSQWTSGLTFLQTTNNLNNYLTAQLFCILVA